MIDEALQAKINHSYDVLKLAADMSKLYYQAPLVITYSGGKDSDTMLQLAIECLKPDEFEVINSHTTVDAPETVYYIRERFSELKRAGIKATIKYPKYKDGSPKSMWNLIPKKGMPPTRLMRYCCTELKETTTPNRFITVGVRKDESDGRKGRDDFSTIGKTKKDAMFVSFSHVREVFEQSEREREKLHNAPNDSDVYDCKFIEQAKTKSDLICNPIYDFTESDVWEFIRNRRMKYNPLYDKGYNRIGCIGCPLGGRNSQLREFSDFPKYKELYIKAFDGMLKQMLKKGKVITNNSNWKWKDGNAVYKWWVQDETLDGQMSLFDEVDDEKSESDTKAG